MLDVHKIHFVLAALEDHKELGREILKLTNDFRRRFAIPSDEKLREESARPSRYDPPETVFVKQMLQWLLPQEVREQITSHLFGKYVSCDEGGFSQELYMQAPHLGEMLSAGMDIGGHGYSHAWLGKVVARVAGCGVAPHAVVSEADLWGSSHRIESAIPTEATTPIQSTWRAGWDA